MECNICMENKNVFYYCDTCCKTLCVDCKETWKRDCPYCRTEYKKDEEVSPGDIEIPITSESPDSQSSFIYSPRSISYIMTREQEEDQRCKRATTVALSLICAGLLVYVLNPINFA